MRGEGVGTADAMERFAQEDGVGMLQNPERITGGGGYAMLVIKDRKQILMPKKVTLWDAVGGLGFLKRTHKAVLDYVNGLGEGPTFAGGGRRICACEERCAFTLCQDTLLLLQEEHSGKNFPLHLVELVGTHRRK